MISNQILSNIFITKFSRKARLSRQVCVQLFESIYKRIKALSIICCLVNDTAQSFYTEARTNC